MFLVIAPFFLLSLEFFVRVSCGLGIIFILMRIYSAYLHKAPKNLNTLAYIFYIPELITGPFRPFNKWGALQIQGVGTRLNILRILNSVIAILLSGLIYGKLVDISSNLAFQSVIAYLTLFVQFSAMTEIVNYVSLSLGLCKVDNFRSPINATSISDFWSRWHISLGDFAKTHINQPATYYFSKKRFFKGLAYPISLLITFIFIGLWHKYSVEYFLFGVYFGIIVFIERKFGDKFTKIFIGKKYSHFLAIIYTQTVHLIGFSFVVDYVKTIIIRP